MIKSKLFFAFLSVHFDWHYLLGLFILYVSSSVSFAVRVFCLGQNVLIESQQVP